MNGYQLTRIRLCVPFAIVSLVAVSLVMVAFGLPAGVYLSCFLSDSLSVDISGNRRGVLMSSPNATLSAADHCCPLCDDTASEHVLHLVQRRKPCPLTGKRPSADERDYLRCNVCHLLYLAPSQRLDAQAERDVYDQHENDPDDPRYRRFLTRLFSPMRERLPEEASGLDFGCGPGPALARMFVEVGHPMALYDLYYHADPTPLARQHDFIVATEVIEHLYDPRAVFRQWLKCLKPGGLLGVMTQPAFDDHEALRRWHYLRDPTHVCLFSPATFQWLANEHGLEYQQVASDCTIFRLPDLQC
ncbi:class I SAM-dependent methyltransferase [Cobetia crustatorum]|uniref:Class I SAM-dependent methyltransferase n=2 Tax=Halomonadaceae TaxID=28256 RepID=A0A558HJ65_9GAMM|nr:class I SAM-dependent methyltransferase [Cobetia crustatorum]